MLHKQNFIIILLGFFLLLFPQISHASIKVVTGDNPVFVSSHVMGNQIVQYQNGNRALEGLIMGFTAAQFPAKTVFSTSTNFIATGKFQSVSNAMTLTDSLGKANLCRYEFNLNFPRAGAMQNLPERRILRNQHLCRRSSGRVLSLLCVGKIADKLRPLIKPHLRWHPQGVCRQL
ncbi:MAG: hypothetical protein K0Q77_1363 [Anaerosporomusa subterranea]|nr:hypothetical protein [Anaerosporomusa subterranea]